jgi:hypothetical protein
MKINDLKKTLGISLLIFVIIQITVFVCYLSFDSGGILMISFAWMLLTIPIFLFTKRKRTTIIYILFNALVAGITISGYYLYKEIEIYNIMTVSLCYIVILTANYLAMYYLQIKRTVNIVSTSLSVLGLVFGIYRWTEGNLTLGSSIVFTSIIILCMNISFLYYLSDKRKYDFMGVVKLSSLLMFGGIFFAVLTAISEGESLTLFDGSWGEGKKKSITKL